MRAKPTKFVQSIRFRLMTSLIAVLVPMGGIVGYAIHTIMKQDIEESIESELNNTTASILSMVETAISVSIKNRLRAIAEKNNEILERIWQKHKDGEYDREQAVALMRVVLLSQKIGKTGYIYCIDNNGTAVLHPKQGVENANWIQFDFIQQQIEKKSGYLEYAWQNPGEPKPRPKALYMSYFKPLDWIITVSSYREEFKELVDVDDFKDSVLAHRFGETGYSYIIDINGNFIIHPAIENYNILMDTEVRSEFFREMVQRKNGKIMYLWKNPDETKPRRKLVYFNYLPDFQWIVASSSYVEEIFSPLKVLRYTIYLIIFPAILIALVIACYLSNSIVSPIRKIIEAFQKSTNGSFTERIENIKQDEIGQLSQYYNQFMDDLERSHAALSQRENQLDMANKMLQLVLDNIPVRVFWKNLNLEYMGCNRLFADDAGLENIDAVKGKTDYDMHWANEYANQFRSIDKYVIENNTAKLRHEEKQSDIQGNVFSVRTSKVPMVDADGKIIGVLGTYEDISEKEAADQKIAETEERFRSLFESSPYGITIMDIDGRFQSMNKSFLDMTGYDIDDLAHRHYYDITPKFYREFEKSLFEDLKKGINLTADTGYEKQFLKKDGTKLPVSMKGWLICDNDSSPLAIGAFVTDISKEKHLVEEKTNLEHQLQHTQKMEAIGTLAGGIAHDFNNILSGIIGYADLAKIALSNMKMDNLERYHKRILEAADRAKDLIQQILQFSRQGHSAQKPMDIRLVVKEVVKLMAATLPTTIKIETHLDIKTTQIFADASQIHQVLMNLCTNAYHAMRNTGGKLSITLSNVYFSEQWAFFDSHVSPGKYVKLCLADTGQGMSKTTLSRIFEPYFSTKKVNEGTGLGLPVTLGIVKYHGGAMDVRSNKGFGTRFDVYFPVAKTYLSHKKIAYRGEVPKGHYERILVVDDEQFFRETVSEILTQLDYEVLVFPGSLGLLDHLKTSNEQYDLIITDQTMPDMTGIQLISEIRKIDTQIPIILCTGFSEHVTPETAHQYDISEFLLKPVDLAGLAGTVKKVLSKTSIT